MVPLKLFSACSSSYPQADITVVCVAP